MKICFLGNGNTTHVYNWMQYFAEKGHQIHLITLDGYRFSPHKNITVHHVKSVLGRNRNFLTMFLLSFRIRKLIGAIQPDIVHGHYLSDYGLLGYFTRFPRLVVTCWGSDILVEPRKYVFRRILAPYILDASVLVTTDSEAARDECLKYCNEPGKTKVVLWGVDLALFHESGERKERRGITVLSTRVFAPNYNIDTIIRAVPLVQKKSPGANVKFVLKSIVASPGLQQLAGELNASGSIEFVCRNMEYRELSELHAGADIFISVPTSDSSSVSLLESMASGLPAIVSDIPANREWITDGWNGFLVPVRDPERLAEAILRLVEQPDLIRVFGERNAQIIRERADREKHMAHMEELYQQLL